MRSRFGLWMRGREVGVEYMGRAPVVGKNEESYGRVDGFFYYRQRTRESTAW